MSTPQARRRLEAALPGPATEDVPGEREQVDVTGGTAARAQATFGTITSPSSTADFEARYDKLKEIGSGQYATVYQAKDQQTNEIVAIKELRFEGRGADDGVEVLGIREMQILKDFVHPNIVQLLCVHIQGLTDFNLIFEYIDIDLQSVLKNHKDACEFMPMQNVRKYSQELLNGLHACCSRRIMHRDLTPSNILIGNGGLKISGFGSARTFSVPTKPYTRDVCTLWYRAPEILLRDSDVRSTLRYGPDVDIWSAGCIVAEMAVGSPMFPGDSEIGTIFKIFRLLGTPTQESWPDFELWHRQTIFPKWPKTNFEPVLWQRPELGESGIDLICKLLALNPDGRLRPLKAKRHPFFDTQESTAEQEAARERKVLAAKWAERKAEEERESETERIFAALLAQQEAEERECKSLVLAAVQQTAQYLESVSKEHQDDRDIVLAAVKKNVAAMQYASERLKGDRDFVLSAVKMNVAALQYASERLKADRDIVLAAVQQNAQYLESVSKEHQDDRDIVLAAVRKNVAAMQYASERLKGDRDFVLTAVQMAGDALEYASAELKTQQDIIIAAVRENPDAIRFAAEGMCQDETCLIAAGLLDERYALRAGQHFIHVLLSVRFSLGPECSPYSNIIYRAMREHQTFRHFLIYNPNLVCKGFCGVTWSNGAADWSRVTDPTFSCRGRCGRGKPTSTSCWRYSFRYHQEISHDSGGFMVQIIERTEGGFGDLELGQGQSIEAEMATLTHIKVFCVKEPEGGRYLEGMPEVALLAREVEAWRRASHVGAGA